MKSNAMEGERPRFYVFTPSITGGDAVSIDARSQVLTLRRRGFEAQLCSALIDPSAGSDVKAIGEVWNLLAESNAVLVYHHSVYWKGLEQLLGHCRKVVVRYHNITPPHFFENIDFNVFMAVKKGLAQTRKIANKFRDIHWVCNSPFTASQLPGLGVSMDHTAVLAPSIQFQPPEIEAERQKNPLGRSALTGKNILFVGRLSPNKGHLHLLDIVKHYEACFGEKLTLHLTGSVKHASVDYLQQIEERINQYCIGDHVVFHDKIGLQALVDLYRQCDVFLCLSEHEGFCVPIVEAQLSRLPIIAYGGSAVGDTAGPDQLVFNNIDIPLFVAALHAVLNDQALRQKLVDQGEVNASRYDNKKISNQFISLMQRFDLLPMERGSR